MGSSGPCALASGGTAGRLEAGPRRGGRASSRPRSRIAPGSRPRGLWCSGAWPGRRPPTAGGAGAAGPGRNRPLSAPRDRPCLRAAGDSAQRLRVLTESANGRPGNARSETPCCIGQETVEAGWAGVTRSILCGLSVSRLGRGCQRLSHVYAF